MSEEIIKPGLVKRVVDLLDDKKIVIGGNKYSYKRRYHLQYTQEIVDNVISALLGAIDIEIGKGNSVRLQGYLSITPTFKPERRSRNVYKNSWFVVPAKYKLKVKCGKKLKDACERYNESLKTDEDNNDK